MKTSLSIYTVDGRKIHIEFRVREPTDLRPLLLAISSREIRDEGVTSDFFPFLTNFFILSFSGSFRLFTHYYQNGVLDIKRRRFCSKIQDNRDIN